MLVALVALWFAVLALALAWVGRSLRVPAGLRLAGVLPAVVLVGAGAVAQAPTDTLSEADAVSRALAASPALRSAEAALDLARAEASLASAFLTEGPELDVDAAFDPRELPVPDEYDVGVTVAQTFERPGVRRARRSAAAGRLALAESARQTALYELTADVRRAVTDLAEAQGAVLLARDARVAADSLAEIARLRFEAGDISELDLRLARTDAAVTAADALGAEGDLVQAQSALARLLALPGSAPLTVLPLGALPPVSISADSVGPGSGVPPGGVADTLGVGRRSDVRAADRAALAAGQEAAYRRSASRFPTFTVRAGIERRALFFGPDDLAADGAPFGDDFRLGRAGTDLMLGLSIPLPFGGLGAREIARAEAEARLREAERDGVVVDARADVVATGRRVLQTEALLGGLAPLEADLAVSDELLDLAGRGGEIDVPTLLAQRDRIRAARRAILAANAEARRARLDLARALGRPAAGLDLDLNDR